MQFTQGRYLIYHTQVSSRRTQNIFYISFPYRYDVFYCDLSGISLIQMSCHIWDKYSYYNGCSYASACASSCHGLSQIKYHNNSHMYVCESCGQEFSGSIKLKRHIAFVHNPDSLFTCQVCGSKFFEARKLRFHMDRVHRDDRPFQCEECGTCFKTSAS
jgi:DNA-directed RNA polymerase subunit RPC12/RpoP